MNTTYFQDLNWRIACPNHMGYEARSAYDANSKVKVIDTSMTSWGRLNKSEIAEIATFQPSICEHCHA